MTGYGLYVELGNTVEGLVHINALKDDYYTFDQETHELRGELTKKVYHLGQNAIRVRVADADAVHSCDKKGLWILRSRKSRRNKLWRRKQGIRLIANNKKAFFTIIL